MRMIPHTHVMYCYTQNIVVSSVHTTMPAVTNLTLERCQRASSLDSSKTGVNL